MLLERGGFTAFGLLTVSVAIGLALTLRLQSASWPRIINSELHNFITLLALIFTGVHGLAAWIDPFTNFGWNEVFIPFASHYRPLWMALGIIALYLGIAIGISTWLRPHIGYKWWRRLHVLTLLLFAHGIATGSDSSNTCGPLGTPHVLFDVSGCNSQPDGVNYIARYPLCLREGIRSTFA